MPGMNGLLRIAALSLALSLASAAGAEEAVWRVSKSSGEVWMSTTGVQPVSLKQEDALKPGDTIRTGRNGRVLLVRGEEKIMVAPNSVIGLPTEKKEGLSTTIVQQAGSILLEVEKRNVKHFEVETPYLAAVVKGTQFRVTVNAGSTKVGVLRGQVEVSDFKTGQIAQVMPGQAATVFEHGKPGLSLTGAGTFNAIEQGKPRASTIERVPVPKSGLPAPRNGANGHMIHALGPIDKGTKAAGALKPSQQAAGAHASKGGAAKPGVVRISNSLGEVKLNVHKVTHGLAHGGGAPGQVRNAHASTETVWSDSKAGTNASNSTVQTAVTTSSGVTAGSTSSSAASTTIAATTAGASSDGSGGGSGNSDSKTKPDKGNSGNGNSGNGNSGNGNSNGNNGATGNGNNGNGNGNGGGNGSNGHGNAFGHNKH